MKVLLQTTAFLLVYATVSIGQIVLQKAVVSNAGGIAANGSTVLNYTVGETAVGVATNANMKGYFGFWNSPSITSSVRGSAGSIKEMTLYPNPASNTITINVSLAASGTLDLLLYDEAGHLVSTLYSGKKGNDTHTIQANVESLTSGTYFIAARVPGALLQKRLTVVR